VNAPALILAYMGQFMRPESWIVQRIVLFLEHHNIVQCNSGGFPIACRVYLQGKVASASHPIADGVKNVIRDESRQVLADVWRNGVNTIS
jgi:hypothetical protein